MPFLCCKVAKGLSFSLRVPIVDFSSPSGNGTATLVGGCWTLDNLPNLATVNFTIAGTTHHFGYNNGSSDWFD